MLAVCSAPGHKKAIFLTEADQVGAHHFLEAGDESFGTLHMDKKHSVTSNETDIDSPIKRALWVLRIGPLSYQSEVAAPLVSAPVAVRVGPEVGNELLGIARWPLRGHASGAGPMSIVRHGVTV